MDGDIELELASDAGEYTVRVVNAPAGGETSGGFSLDVEAIIERLATLEATVLASAVTARRTIPLVEKPLHEVGETLFQALFAGPVHGTYRASLGAAQHSGRPLRVVLRLIAPELAALPWELMFDPETGSYLCQDLPLLRRIPSADFSPHPLEVEIPLRILGIVSSPRDLPGLDSEAEKRHLAEALAEPIAAGLVDLVWVPRATWEGIQTMLLEGPWHVLHFIGHGDYDRNGQEGRLALESAGGRTDMVRASNIMQLLREAEPTPRLVVLNSCSSGETGTEDLFSGTAAALVRGGISAVAAMQFTVSDAAAVAFSRGFYGALAHGRDIDKAAGSGRRSIMGLGTLEWVTPVLYIRGGSTKLFNFTGEPARSAHSDSTVQDLSPASKLQDLYVRATVEMRLKRYGKALTVLDELLAHEPGNKEAASLRNAARHQQEMAGIYDAAHSAEDAGDWEAAARAYSLVQNEPGFEDAAGRREACMARLRVANLQNVIRSQARAGNWPAVLATDAELTALDPASADPDGLARRASREILSAQASLEDVHVHKVGIEELSQPLDFEQVPKPSATGQLLDSWLLDVNSSKTVRAVTFSPDGRRFATGSDDRTARIWNTATGQSLLIIPHDLKVRSVAFSPDGTRLATASDSNHVLIWDARTGTEVLKLKVGGWYLSASAVAFSPDGARLAVGTSMSSASIWDTHTGAEYRKVVHDGPVHAVVFSPDGTLLATASDDKTVRIWNADTGGSRLKISQNAKIRSLAFSPDGTRLATGSDNNYARIWDVRSGDEKLKLKVGSWPWFVLTVAFSPDGTRLATGSDNNNATIWDAITGAELRKLTHGGSVRAVAFSPDGTRFATGSDDKTVRIWNVAGV